MSDTAYSLLSTPRSSLEADRWKSLHAKCLALLKGTFKGSSIAALEASVKSSDHHLGSHFKDCRNAALLCVPAGGDGGDGSATQQALQEAEVLSCVNYAWLHRESNERENCFQLLWAATREDGPYRKKGLATLLVAHLRKVAWQDAQHKFMTVSVCDSEAAQLFWKHCGFVPLTELALEREREEKQRAAVHKLTRAGHVYWLGQGAERVWAQSSNQDPGFQPALAKACRKLGGSPLTHTAAGPALLHVPALTPTSSAPTSGSATPGSAGTSALSHAGSGTGPPSTAIAAPPPPPAAQHTTITTSAAAAAARKPLCTPMIGTKRSAGAAALGSALTAATSGGGLARSSMPGAAGTSAGSPVAGAASASATAAPLPRPRNTAAGAHLTATAHAPPGLAGIAAAGGIAAAAAAAAAAGHPCQLAAKRPLEHADGGSCRGDGVGGRVVKPRGGDTAGGSRGTGGTAGSPAPGGTRVAGALHLSSSAEQVPIRVCAHQRAPLALSTGGAPGGTSTCPRGGTPSLTPAKPAAGKAGAAAHAAASRTPRGTLMPTLTTAAAFTAANGAPHVRPGGVAAQAPHAAARRSTVAPLPVAPAVLPALPVGAALSTLPGQAATPSAAPAFPVQPGAAAVRRPAPQLAAPRPSQVRSAPCRPPACTLRAVSPPAAPRAPPCVPPCTLTEASGLQQPASQPRDAGGNARAAAAKSAAPVAAAAVPAQHSSPTRAPSAEPMVSLPAAMVRHVAEKLVILTAAQQAAEQRADISDAARREAETASATLAARLAEATQRLADLAGCCGDAEARHQDDHCRTQQAAQEGARVLEGQLAEARARLATAAARVEAAEGGRLMRVREAEEQGRAAQAARAALQGSREALLSTQAQLSAAAARHEAAEQQRGREAASTGQEAAAAQAAVRVQLAVVEGERDAALRLLQQAELVVHDAAQQGEPTLPDGGVRDAASGSWFSRQGEAEDCLAAPANTEGGARGSGAVSSLGQAAPAALMSGLARMTVRLAQSARQCAEAGEGRAEAQGRQAVAEQRAKQLESALACAGRELAVAVSRASVADAGRLLAVHEAQAQATQAQAGQQAALDLLDLHMGAEAQRVSAAEMISRLATAAQGATADMAARLQTAEHERDAALRQLCHAREAAEGAQGATVGAQAGQGARAGAAAAEETASAATALPAAALDTCITNSLPAAAPAPAAPTAAAAAGRQRRGGGSKENNEEAFPAVQAHAQVEAAHSAEAQPQHAAACGAPASQAAPQHHAVPASAAHGPCRDSKALAALSSTAASAAPAGEEPAPTAVPPPAPSATALLPAGTSDAPAVGAVAAAAATAAAAVAASHVAAQRSPSKAHPASVEAPGVGPAERPKEKRAAASALGVVTWPASVVPLLVSPRAVLLCTRGPSASKVLCVGPPDASLVCTVREKGD